MNGEDKLHILRALMKERGYDIYIIPHEDQYNSEYLAESDERIKFISNFSGNNGIGLVTQEIALIWTDERYFIQIQKELYPGWKMKKISDEDESLSQYILNNIPKKSTIGMDFSLFTQEKAISLKIILRKYRFVDDINNLIDDIWGTLKPRYNCNRVLILPIEFSGKSVYEKYKMLDLALQKKINSVKDFRENKNYRMLISKLENIAWLLNLRGNDIPYNPVFFSYAFFYKINGEFYTELYVNKDKFDSIEIKKYCIENKIKLFDYKYIIENSKKPSEDLITFLEEESTNHRIYEKILNIKEGKTFLLGEDIIEDIKSIKNKVEIEGFKNANIKDSVSLIKFLSWMEEELVAKNRNDINEYQIGIKNKQIREEQEHFMGESFSPICAVGPNASIIHYEQNENFHSDINKNLILLCETGSHYKDGTTDITRTIHFGNPTKKEKEMYTRVLLGNLSLERLIFKKGKTLWKLDSIPRYFLNMVGKDYLHGTSHGVGHFLNVHEGPYVKALKPGNIVTNEPGYYEEDNFGIRIGNEILVIEKDESHLGFENLTFLPYERNLINIDLISNDFKKYIDDFHKKCFEKLSPFLKGDEKALKYLAKKTQPL